MKKILILLFALALVGMAFADVITIGTGTSYSYEPIASWYGFHRSAAIYRSAEVGGSGTINTISYKAYNTTTTAIPIKVYMKMTTAASLSPAQSWPTLISGLTPIYEGTFSGTTAGAWKTITLTTPFAYTGSNLQILIESNYGGGGTSGPQWYNTTATNLNQYIRKDNTAPTTETGTVNSARPNIQLDMSGYSAFPPLFAVNLPTVAFGNVVVNTTTAYTDVIVSNGGSGTLNVTNLILGGTDTARFILDMNSNPTPWTLTAGQSKTVKVAFNPIAEANYSAFLQFTADARFEHNVNLTGTGVDPTIVTFPYIENFDSVTAPALPPFWSITQGTGASQQWKTTTTDDHGAFAPNSGTNFAYLYCYLASTTYNPYSMITPPIALDATAKRLSYYYWIGDATAAEPLFIDISTDLTTWTTLYTHSNATNTLAWFNNTVNLSAYASTTVYLRFRGVSNYGSNLCDLGIDDVVVEDIPATPVISANPNTWDFGTALINTSTPKVFTITNTGVGSLDISSLNVTGSGFAIAGAFGPISLLEDESVNFTVNFAPLTPGNFNGMVTISSNVDPLLIPLSGEAVDPTITIFDPPYFEGFESATVPALPLGWTAIDNNADGDKWVSYASNPRTGTKCAMIYTDYNATNDDYLVTPPLALTGNQELKFWTRAQSAGEPEEISVLLSTTTPTPGAFTNVLMASTPVNYTTYTEYTVNLSAYSGTCYISFTRKNPPADGWRLYLDDVTIRNYPDVPIFSVTPSSWDFGQVDLNVPVTKIFTITNAGGGVLDLTSVNITAGNAYYTISVPPANMSLGIGESTPFTVRYLPTTEEAHAGTVTIVHSLGTATIALDGLGQFRIPGSTVGSPYPVTLPLVGFTGDTSLYGDDYESGWVTPANYYIGGDDMVLQFTLAVPSTVSGTLSATDGGTWVGMIIVNTTPNPLNPAPVLGSATSSGSTATMAGVNLPAGTYYLIIGTFPSPQSFQFSLDLNAVALTAPGPVTLTAPVNNAAGVALLPTFTWTAPTAGSAPTGYRVYCDQNPNPTTLLNTVTGLTYTATTSLIYNTLYYWKVVAFNSVGDGADSPVWSFTSRVDPASDPTAPILISPAEAAVVPIAGFNFAWAINGTGGNPTGYTLYVSSTDDVSDFWNTEYMYVLGAAVTSYDPTQDPSNPITYAYDNHYFWTVTAHNDEHQWPPREFVIEPDPHVAIPYTQDFGTDGSWPTNWSQTYSGGVTSNRWTVTNTSLAGGVPYEMTAGWVSGTGITRLISPPVSTAGVPMFQVVFDHLYDDYAAGITAKLQYSHDLVTWHNSPWSIVSGGGNVSGLTSVLFTGISAPTTYVAWVLDGNHFQFDNWSVDNVIVQVPSAHDVAPISWDVAVQVVPENTLVTPKATVINNGINTETFTVTCTIGTYSDTQTVTALAMGATQQVTFAPFTPAVWTAENVLVQTNLVGDLLPGNDQLFDALICLPLDTPGLANNLQTDEFVSFNLTTPGTFNILTNAYTGTGFVAGADWMNGTWKGVEYDSGTLTTDNYLNIDPLTGAYTSLGQMGAALSGNAWDDVHEIMYGTGGGNLYTMNPLTGLATIVATLWYDLSGTPTNLADIGGLMIAIAYDNTNEILYGIDLGNDCLWKINPITCELELVGFLGIDLNYAQDAAFDQDNGLLFLAGYTNADGGALYWIDTLGGGAYAVGSFPNAHELAGFAIPYGSLAAAPVVTIAGAGILSWDPVLGAIHYNVYSSDTPYGTFTLEATVRGTSYTGPAAAKKFYKVTAVGGRAVSSHQTIENNISRRNAPSQKNGKADQIGLAPLRKK